MQINKLSKLHTLHTQNTFDLHHETISNEWPMSSLCWGEFILCYDWHNSAELKEVNLIDVEHDSFLRRNCLDCVQSLFIVIIFIVDQSCLDMLCPYRILCYQNRPKHTEIKLMHFCHIIKFHVERKNGIIQSIMYHVEHQNLNRLMIRTKLSNKLMCVSWLKCAIAEDATELHIKVALP